MSTIELASARLDALERDKIIKGTRFRQWSNCADQLPELFKGKPGSYNHASKDTRFVYMVSPGRQPVPMPLTGSYKWPGEDTNETDLKVGPEYVERKIKTQTRAHKIDFEINAYYEIHKGPQANQFLESDVILDTLEGAVTQDAMIERLTKGTTYTGDLYQVDDTGGVTEVTGTPSWIYDVVIKADPDLPYYSTLDKLEKGTALEIVDSGGTSVALGIVTAPDNSTDATKRGRQFRIDCVAEISSPGSINSTYTIRLWRRSAGYFPYSLPDMIGEGQWPLTALGDSGPTIAALGRLGKSVVVTPAGASAVENDWDVLLDTIEDRSATFRRVNGGGGGEVVILCDKETKRRFVNRQREQKQFTARDRNDILPAGMELFRDGVGIKALTPWPKGLVLVFETSNIAYGTNLNQGGNYVQPAPIFVYPGQSTFGKAAMGLANISETYPTGSVFMFNSYSNSVHDRSATGRGENFNLSA